jgi:putative transposase
MNIKTIKIKLGPLTSKKRKLLQREVENFNKNLKGEEAPLYSATLQHTTRYYKKGKIKKNKIYPLSLRNDVFKLLKTKNRKYRHFFKIPIYGVRGGIRVPLHTTSYHVPIVDNSDSFGDSKITKQGKDFFLHLTCRKKKTKIAIGKNSLPISVDLGERNAAVSVTLQNPTMNPVFHGTKTLRKIRAHYRRLRTALGKKTLLKKIKQMAQKEQKAVNAVLHKISRDLVTHAQNLKNAGKRPVILLGDLKYIRKATESKGRKMRRIINQWPFYRLQQFITYKAISAGIPVAIISERNTSKTCHRCKCKGTRKRGLFKCNHCGLEYNADINGAINIGHRFLGYMLGNRATMTSLQSGAVKFVCTTPQPSNVQPCGYPSL